MVEPRSEVASTVEGTPDPGGAHTAPRTELAPGTRLGRFVTLRRLGAGGMGVVYEAYDPELDRKVALKLLRVSGSPSDPCGADHPRLLREAQAMAQLSHPNVITVYDVGTFEGEVFIAMELIEGQDLRRWLDERPRPWREALDPFMQAGAGLAAAHAAGLVHRDFKPGNVLVGRDGRARVLDFGLVRPTGAGRGADRETLPADGVQSGSLLDTPLTVRGAVIGTPAYMSPEQLGGQDVDPRTDQFAFAVALYEALYRTRPFADPPSLAALLASPRRTVLPPPSRPHLPAGIRKALLRALSPDPGDRFPGMADLLAALQRAASGRARAWRAASLAGLAAAGVAIAFLVTAPQGVPGPCTGSEERWASAWGAERRGRVEAAFGASGSPLAETTLPRVVATLDGYGEAWIGARVEACLATHARHEQSAELLDLRMTCLDRRLREVRALVDLLESADAGVVAEAPKAALALRPPDTCADIEALRAPLQPPADERSREAAAAVQGRLARAQALSDAGLPARALDEARAALANAQTLGHEPLLAEAQLLLADLLERGSDLDEATRLATSALATAQRSRHEEVVARSLGILIWINGYDLVQAGSYEVLASLASATLDRVGDDGLLRAELAVSYGSALQANRRLPEAAAQFEVAIALRAKRLGPTHYATAKARNNLANVLYGQGRNEEALAIYQDVLRALEAALGPGHPDLATALANIGAAEQALRRFDRAEEVLLRALEIRRAAFGDDNVQTAIAAINLAGVRLEMGRRSEALEQYRKAGRTLTHALGEQHPYCGFTLVGVGRCLLDLGRPGEALGPLEKGLGLMEAGGPFAASDLAETRFALARALWDSGTNRGRAQKLAREALLVPGEGDQATRLRVEVHRWLDAHGGS